MDETRLDPRTPEGDDSSLESLAAEYVRNRLAGEASDPAPYLERLPGGDDKTRFLELVEGAEQVDGILPRQVREGTLLAGRYRIVREVGAGGMGKVFVAWDGTLKREVAVKILAMFDTGTVDVGSMFRRESELLASLQHPGIVSIHETGTDGDTPYIIMDLVKGTSLREVLIRLRGEAGTQPPPRSGAAWREAIDHPIPDGGRDLIGEDGFCRVAARIAAELARTVEAAHGKGVVHRDLKPGNVILRGDGTPIVLDFGLAGRFDGAAGELTSGLFGSTAYVAPEQIRSERTGSDPATDIYQLGLIMYEMLTLGRAFEGDDASSVLSDICTGRFEAPRRANRVIPVELEAIVLKAMELDPNRRYSSATELREDLERFLSGEEAPLAMGGGWLSIMLRDGRYFARRHRLGIQVAAALLIGAVAAWKFAPREVVDDGLRDVRPFTFARASGVQDFGATAIRAGDEIGVEIVTDRPRCVYAYALFGPEDDPYRYVAHLAPAPLGGEELERVDPGLAFARWIPAGTTELRCSEASAESACEGVVFFALDEPYPPLDWWLSEIKKRDEPITLVEAIRWIGEAKAQDVFPPTRGGSVSPYLTESAKESAVESMRNRITRIDFEYPFDDLEQERLVLFPVEKE